MAGKVTTQLVIEGQDKTKAAFGQVDKSLGGLSESAKAAGAAIAGALSVGVFAGWIKGATDAAAEMGKLATLSGATVETFSAWSYAAKSVGIEQDKLGDIFKDVQDKVGDFLSTGGGGMADFFENIAPKVGVTAEQFRNLSGPDALQLYVSSLEKAGVAQSEMVFYLEAIASDSTLLLPLLQNNAEGLRKLTDEAREFGLVVSSETAAQAKEFSAQLNTLGAASSSVGQQVAAEMLPAMNELTGLMVDFAKDSGAASTAADVVSFAMRVLGTAVIAAGSTFASLGRLIGASAAAAVAAVSGEFSEAAQIMRDVSADNEAAAREAESKIKRLWDGSYEAQGKAAREAAEAQARVAEELRKTQEQQARSTESHVKVMADQYKKLAEAAKARLSELTAAERAATSDLEKLRDERLDIEERYNSAISSLTAGPAEDPSYAAASALKSQARRNMVDGDYESMRRNAQAALDMLQALKDAGEDTSGFEGFAKELRQIELAANDIERTAAEEKLKTITDEIARIKSAADPLKELKIDFKLSEEDRARVKTLMEQLAAELKQTLVIPVTPVSAGSGPYDQPYTLQDPGEPPKFATGGYVSGPGSGTSDSILARLSNGEFVMRAQAVKHYGPQLLSLMNGLQLPKFADGGLVSSLQPASPQSLGTLNFNLPGGESFGVTVVGDQWADLHKAAIKYGRTTRR